VHTIQTVCELSVIFAHICMLHASVRHAFLSSLQEQFVLQYEE